MWVDTLISTSEWLFLLYFLGLTAGYLMLDLIAIVHLRQYLQERVLESLPHSYTGFEPQISILVPAYNEAATIAGSIRSLLQLSYSEYEIVVINDGSRMPRSMSSAKNLICFRSPKPVIRNCRRRKSENLSLLESYQSSRHRQRKRRQGGLPERRHQLVDLSPVLLHRCRFHSPAGQPAASGATVSGTTIARSPAEEPCASRMVAASKTAS